MPAHASTSLSPTPWRAGAPVAAAIVVAVVRWALTADRRIFHVAPDEPSQLAVARWLAGGTRWNMFDHATWQPGLAVLIAPFYRFTDDGEIVVRLALALNTVIGGLGAALLAVLIRRLSNLPAISCCVIAIVVGVAPSSLSASSFVWAEPLIALAVVGTVLLLLRTWRLRTVGAACWAVTAAVAGYAAHSRLLPLVATTIALVVGRELGARRWSAAAWIAAVSGGLMALSAAWKSWVLSEVWDDPANQNTVGAVLRRLRHLDDVAESLLGQIWYQLAATFGLFAIGVVVVVRSLRAPRASLNDRGHPDIRTDIEGDAQTDIEAGGETDIETGEPCGTTDRTVGPRPIDPTERLDPVAARLILATVAPLVLVSAIFMSDRPRPDQAIYGRYNDAVVWPIVALGLAWVAGRLRTGWRRSHLVTVAAVVAALIGSGIAIDRLHGDALRESFGVRAMIAGLLAYVQTSGTIDVWRVTVITAAATVAATAWLAVAASIRPLRVPMLAIATATAIGVVAIGLARTDDVLDERLNGWQRSGAVTDVDALIPPGATLAVKTVADGDDPVVSFTTQRQRYLVYQFYLPDRIFLRDRGLDDDVGPFVFAPLEDPDLTGADAELIWTDPSTQIGLWREP